MESIEAHPVSCLPTIRQQGSNFRTCGVNSSLFLLKVVAEVKESAMGAPQSDRIEVQLCSPEADNIQPQKQGMADSRNLYSVKFIRRIKSWKRGSERKSSKQGSTFNSTIQLARC